MLSISRLSTYVHLCPLFLTPYINISIITAKDNWFVLSSTLLSMIDVIYLYLVIQLINCYFMGVIGICLKCIS